MRDDSLQLGGKSGQKKFSPFLKPRDLDCSLHTLDDLPRQKDSIETDFQKRQALQYQRPQFGVFGVGSIGKS